MEREVFITKIASYFPNNPVENDEMEDFLGLIGGKPSRVKNIILRQNSIKRRYYALNKKHEITHTNAEMAGLAIKKMLTREELRTIEVLSCGTSSPDQYLPSHASMVHGEAFEHPLEIFSLAGVCMTGIAALKTSYMSIMSGNSQNAVCSASELSSAALLSKSYEKEYEDIANVSANPIIAFEKDFLRFMLSDGAACCLLEGKPCGGLSLQIDWIECISYADRMPVCMYMGGDLDAEGNLVGWKKFSTDEIQKKSIWALKQNVKILNGNVMRLFVDAIEYAFGKHDASPSDIKYVIPHISSMYFYHVLAKEIESRGIDLPTDKWFTNLTTVGNIGSVAIFAALDELVRTKELNDGDKILLLVPESGRFSYGVVLLTVKKN